MRATHEHASRGAHIDMAAPAQTPAAAVVLILDAFLGVLQRADKQLAPVVMRNLGLFDQRYGGLQCLDCTRILPYQTATC